MNHDGQSEPGSLNQHHESSPLLPVSAFLTTWKAGHPLLLSAVLGSKVLELKSVGSRLPSESAWQQDFYYY